MRFPSSSVIMPAALLLATGCSQAMGGYPSLAPRAIEKIDVGVAPPPAPAVASPVDPALEARTAEHLRAARDAAAIFNRALAIAREAAASAGTAGSESWVDAQQKLTVAQQARTAMVTAVADLDAVRIAQAQRGGADTTTLEAAWNEAAALDRAQSAQLDAVATRLAAP